jgi:hypothetical protein
MDQGQMPETPARFDMTMLIGVELCPDRHADTRLGGHFSTPDHKQNESGGLRRQGWLLSRRPSRPRG